jgi:hypothetical protein
MEKVILGSTFATIITFLILDIDSEFILFIDKLFDSLNGKSKISQKSKPLKGGVTRNSGHEKFWKNSIKLLEKMSFWDEDKRKLVNVPSLQNLIKTLRGFIYLQNMFCSKKLNTLCLDFQPGLSGEFLCQYKIAWGTIYFP